MTTNSDIAASFEVDGGRHLYLECRGTGSPIVILESGYGHSGRVWQTDVLPGSWTPSAEPRTTVFEGVSELTRVCLYDRPGTILPTGAAFEPSRSAPAPIPRGIGAMVDDLHKLLTAAGMPGPYVLVGHSLGGLLGRVFAARHPGAVAGMVLVDAFSAELWQRLGAALSPENWDAFQALEAAPRIELQAVYPAAELIDLDAIVIEEHDLLDERPLQPMPLVVLTRGRSVEAVVPPEALPPGFPWAVVEREAFAAQASLAALVPGARHAVATESGHMIQLDQPELVIDAIRQVVAAVRDPAAWSTPAQS